ncbi:MAG TPA: S-methyl-5-thioribose-1-phosphate isomerase [Gemmatimonadaceae bacterium]|jgi:methylthioribose-1-phosphate isomerase|nr:S-methyl-5-thioribose-1-phosphate isomerase [Gemmatimonadaceae bacterium]
MSVVEAVRWSVAGDAVDIIDQRALPGRLSRLELRTVDEICDAIATLAVRGAPAIGCTGAMGLVVALAPFVHLERADFLAEGERLGARIACVRPTAVNLSWAVRRLLDHARATLGDGPALHAALRNEATCVLDEDRAMCRRIGEHGLALLADGSRVLTHCNAGALATAGIGTALAPVYVAAERGLRVSVFADETRPLLQGSRLTAWELAQAGIDVTVLTDNVAASLMRAGRVDVVIVGADRIAANGDVANKIGTYPLALAARHHDVPFYVAAPWSTVDAATASGDDIVIEHRGADELGRGFESPVAPSGVATFNPAFDVTPAELVTAFITDRGVIRGPYRFEPDGHARAVTG